MGLFPEDIIKLKLSAKHSYLSEDFLCLKLDQEEPTQGPLDRCFSVSPPKPASERAPVKLGVFLKKPLWSLTFGMFICGEAQGFFPEFKSNTILANSIWGILE